MTDIEALRARMRETAESGFDYLEVPASDCLALDAEITRLTEARRKDAEAWESLRAANNVVRDRAKAAEASLASYKEEVERLRGVLETIANLHIPDQPAHFGGDELEWAQRHVGTLRRLATEALTQEPTNAE